MGEPYDRDPIRTVRVSEDLWRAAKERASRRGESLSEVIRTALAAYVDES